MIKPGICSITLAKSSPETVIETAVKGGLSGIEWWGKAGHLPMGDTAAAEKLGKMTRDAGLEPAVYGSYYRIGATTGDLNALIDTTLALGAKKARVWASDTGFNPHDKARVEAFAADLQRAGDAAGKAGIKLSIEHHMNTFTDCYYGVDYVMNQTVHPDVQLSWQPPHGFSTVDLENSLLQVLPRLGLIHTFTWSYTWGTNPYVRLAWQDGAGAWRKYFGIARDVDCYAMIEFTRNDDPACALEDALALKKVLGEING